MGSPVNWGSRGLQSKAGVKTVREWLGLAASSTEVQFMECPGMLFICEYQWSMTLLGRSRDTTSTVNGTHKSR
jgi:hypothetical protein